METITHQEDIIKANKEILEQLYADIADLESRKSKLEESRSNFDDSDSSRDVLSEMNAVAELEQQVTMKNKHIRKLLSDVKVSINPYLNLYVNKCIEQSGILIYDFILGFRRREY